MWTGVHVGGMNSVVVHEYRCELRGLTMDVNVCLNEMILVECCSECR